MLRGLQILRRSQPRNNILRQRGAQIKLCNEVGRIEIRGLLKMSDRLVIVGVSVRNHPQIQLFA